MPGETSFDGFPPATFAWFDGLLRDNSRDYVAATRDALEGAVRGPLAALLGELAEEFGGTVKLFRQNRDVRFSRDKSPYKTTTYGILHERPGTEAALYAEVSRDGLFAGTGIYAPARDQLARYRSAVADDAAGPELEAIVAGIEAAGLEVFGETLRGAPRGFPRDHPRIRLLRHTLLVVGASRPVGDDGGIDRGDALAHVAGTWRTARPLTDWLDAHVGRSEVPPAQRWGQG